PNYYRVPTKKEQLEYEMALDRHLKAYKYNHRTWDAIKVGANDVPLDAAGNAAGDLPPDPPVLSLNDLYDGNGDDSIPWFFQSGRHPPNLASYKVHDYAVITIRIARKAGLALIGTFIGDWNRRFAITTDARLVPTSKLKPARGSAFHGVDLTNGWQLPVAFVHRDDAKSYTNLEDETAQLPGHTALQLTGRSIRVDPERHRPSEHGDRLVEIAGGNWVREADVAIAVKPSELPSFAKGNQKWIDVSINSQTLVLYEGARPIYAT